MVGLIVVGCSIAAAILFSKGYERTGAICRDGAHSYSTGQGTGSHHGGVARWTSKVVRDSLFNKMKKRWRKRK